MGDCGWNFGLKNKVEWRSSSVSICSLFQGKRVCTQESVAMSKKQLQADMEELLTRAQRNGIELNFKNGARYKVKM